MAQVLGVKGLEKENMSARGIEEWRETGQNKVQRARNIPQ